MGVTRGVAQLGSALRSGRRGRRFKSCHPDDVMSRDICPHMSRDFLGFWGGCFGSFVRFGFGVFQDICPFFGVNTQIVCIFRACRVGLVSCPAFADV